MLQQVKNSDFALLGVRLLSSRGQLEAADLLVSASGQASVLPSEHRAHKIDAKGLCLLPAGVDPQVHLRVPGQPEKETPETGLQAAVQGGIGALLTMPNTKPVIDSPEACHLARQELQSACDTTGVEVLLSAAITRGQKGQELVDFSSLVKAGVAAFTDDGVGVVQDEHMRAAFRASAESGLPILQHAENPGHGGVLAPSKAQEQLGVRAYPASAESDMVARDLRLLAEFPGARYHVLHVSAQATLDEVRRAKDKGLQVTCEVSPHHLYFSGDDINPNFSSFKMNPPLRSQKDRAALRAALRDGTCDFVATDHAPHEAAIKTQNFKTAAYGTTGLETSLRVLLTLVQQGELSMARLVDVFSSRPAAFLGLQQFGSIKMNAPLFAVLVDADKEPTAVTEIDLASKSANNCFLQSPLSGEIKGVFLGDKFWFKEGFSLS